MTGKKRDLELTARRYQTALTHQVYGIILVGEDDRVDLVNQTFCDMFHLNVSAALLTGLTSAEFLRLITPAYADPAGTLARIGNVLAAGRDHLGDEVLMADGRVFLVDYTPIVIDGKPSGRMWQHRDITARKEAEAALAAERQRLSFILEGTNAGTWEWNVQTGETIFNERWAEMIGYTLKELAPVSIETWKRFTQPADLEVSDGLLEKHFKKESEYYECEVRMRHKNESWIWVLDRGKVATWTEDGKPLMMSGTHQDITDRKRSEEKIRHMANHDGLTDLPSLRLAKDRLTMAMSAARRNKTAVAVMFIDLDGFKAVNDAFGHDSGDQVLKEVAKRFVAGIRGTDTVARVGGDEFLLVITELQSPEIDNAAKIAKKTLRLVSQPVVFEGWQASVGASIGISLFPRDGEEIDVLIKLADEAMYKIKYSSKYGYSFAKPSK